MATQREISRVVRTERMREGGGFEVRRPFPTRTLEDLDPFLLLDHLGPVDYAPDQAIGAPDHPHRGFETVSYILEGQLRHRDSRGHEGRLGPGDVQWMTAGSGVVHSEMPAPELQQQGGRMHGFQLWVNLPRRDKMMPPRYQDVPGARLPVASTADGLVRVKVIAGEALGQRAVIETRTPIFFLHFSLQAGGAVEQPIASGHRAFAYVYSGEARLGPRERPVKEGEMAVLGDEGEALTLRGGPAEVLLIGGVPLHEPVARYGPFVMNTEAELVEAFHDFQAGRMGRIR